MVSRFQPLGWLGHFSRLYDELERKDKMKLYRYISLERLWHVLDIVVNNRLYCAHWSQLNDPLEGRYEISSRELSMSVGETMAERIEKAKDTYRIASLSADPTSFLMWSHYANGHKGAVIEVDIPDEEPELYRVIYTEFQSVFTEKTQTEKDMRHIFNGKTEEWKYEQEYRLITEEPYFVLENPVERILLGSAVSNEHTNIMKTLLGSQIQLIQMELGERLGIPAMTSSEAEVIPTPPTKRFVWSWDN